MRALAFVLLVVIACTPQSSTANPGGATSTIRTFVRATPLIAGPSLGFRQTTVPTDFRYLAGAELAASRIWLVDTANGSVVDVVAQDTGNARLLVFSASADGKHLAVAGPGTTGRASVTIIDVELGRAKSIYLDPDIDSPGVLSPVISPDGTRVAFANQSGVRLVDVATGTTIRTVPHQDPRSTGGLWRPLAWSTDANWLAIGRGSEGQSEVAIVDVGRETRVLGVGTLAAWRAKAPELVVMDTITTNGGESVSYTYDLATNRGTPLEQKGSQRRAGLAWHPNGDRFLYLAAPGPFPLGDLYVRAPNDQVAAKVNAPRSVIDGWWSHDGSKIYGLLIRQDTLRDAIGDANYEIAELPSGGVVATVCRGDPRAVCL